MFTKASSSSSVQKRVDTLSRQHVNRAIYIESDRPQLLENELDREERTVNATIGVIGSLTEQEQDLIHGDRPGSLTNEQIQDASKYIPHLTGEAPSQRPDLIGHQRITIFHSDVSVADLALSHHCHISTIYRIKNDPLSSLGITWKQLKMLLSDSIDTNLMFWNTNMVGVPDFILPPIDLSIRPGKRPKLGTQEISFIRMFLTHFPDAYLDEILEAVTFFRPGIEVSISTLSRCLTKMGFSQKIPNKILSRSDEDERMMFAQFFTQNQISINQLVFIDEVCNARYSGEKRLARSPKRTQALGTFKSTGTRVSMLGAIDVSGLICYELIPGSYNRENFEIFLIETLLPAMTPFPGESSVLVLDNAKIHSPEIIDQLWELFHVKVIFLPPYSPDFNPIERLFSSLKAAMKRIIGSYPNYRRNPFELWRLCLEYVVPGFDFESVVTSTYVADGDDLVSIRV